MNVDTATIPSTAGQIKQRVAELVPVFRARIEASNRDRSIPRESIDDLVDAGLARMLVPARFGGSALTTRDAVEVTTAVAHGCPSTAWLSWLMIHDPQLVSMFPLEAQEAVWADGPDVVVAGSHMGMTITPVEGGYRLSGRGAFTSGSNNAGWVYVGGMLPQPAGPPQIRYFLLRAGQYTVEDTWDTVGMRGTGSNTVVVDDVFVPESFSMLHDDARDGTSPGSKIHDTPALRQPWVAIGSLGFISTIVGASQAAYQEVAAALAQKRTPAGARVAESEGLQVDVGLIAAKLDAALELLNGQADRADAGGDLTLEERAARSRTQTFAAQLALEAIDKLMEIGGTSMFASGAFAQQVWRDVHFAAAHISISKRATYARHARAVLGVEPPFELFY
ncbi:acyl-CoA dehydrogenase family protein [Georgenia sp. SYP-B2076]|uniref:acyl-CoA dehydrogenase family protein n=1 Tax=Georgenia sp. SYP-B2076 TaxID=2495881 RepID=UPI000F8C5CBE|nr:acyl-CoA dehydrogenase family protein [Georgenia sp. SYP-B2076]